MGDNEDGSGCYLCLLAPLETWPMALAILISLTSANDITALCPDINPGAECSRKKSNRDGVPHRKPAGEHMHCSAHSSAASLGVFRKI